MLKERVRRKQAQEPGEATEDNECAQSRREVSAAGAGQLQLSGMSLVQPVVCEMVTK